MADRYLTTREAARVLRVDTQRAWRILRDAGLEPLGKPCRDDDWKGMECVWRIHRTRQKTSGIQRMIRANILRGIERKRAKREAANA